MRHAANEASADLVGEARRRLGDLQSDVVHLHDQSDDAVDDHGDDDRHDGKDHQSAPEAFACDGVECDHHDLGGQDQVGADGARNHCFFVARMLVSGLVVVTVAEDCTPDLVNRFVAEVTAADHQQWRQQPGEELTQQQSDRKNDQQLVAQRSDGDALDDGQLAFGREPTDVLRRDGCVVDDDACRFGGRLTGCGGNVVDRGGSHTSQGCDVVEQGEESSGHHRPPVESVEKGGRTDPVTQLLDRTRSLSMMVVGEVRSPGTIPGASVRDDLARQVALRHERSSRPGARV